jgi:hypothetical protein
MRAGDQALPHLLPRRRHPKHPFCTQTGSPGNDWSDPVSRCLPFFQVLPYSFQHRARPVLLEVEHLQQWAVTEWSANLTVQFGGLANQQWSAVPKGGAWIWHTWECPSDWYRMSVSLGPARPPERELMKTIRGASVMSGAAKLFVPTR